MPTSLVADRTGALVANAAVRSRTSIRRPDSATPVEVSGSRPVADLLRCR